jgi:hypothetical protein
MTVAANDGIFKGDHPMRKVALAAFMWTVVGCTGIGLWAAGTEPANVPDPMAANLYQEAARAIVVKSPASADFKSPPYPPDSADWRKAAIAAWDADASTRLMVHHARHLNDTQWPDDPSYLVPCREVGNNLGDAALYLDFQGWHAQAVDQVRDMIHLADLLQEKRPSYGLLVRMLYGAGVRAMALNRLQQIVAGIQITDDASNIHDLQASTARELIAQLLGAPKAIDVMTDTMGGPPGSVAWMVLDKKLNERTLSVFARVKTECTFAAILLACHVYESEKGHWPADLNQMVPDDLPSVPIDPWSKDARTFGYRVIKGGLPDGGDRPLIYCRLSSEDGLFFSINEPHYSFYDDDREGGLSGIHKHGGQFRDIVRWQAQTKNSAPMTRPLP